MNRRQPPLKAPQKPMIDVANVIWGSDTPAFATQAISDDTARESQTNRAIPQEACVKEAKDWVDFNEK